MFCGLINKWICVVVLICLVVVISDIDVLVFFEEVLSGNFVFVWVEIVVGGFVFVLGS